MSELETRLREELGSRAEEAGAWTGAGATLRRAAHDQRVRRLRTAAVTMTAATVLAVVGVVAFAGGNPTRKADLPAATPTPTASAVVTPALQVPVPDEVVEKAQDRTGAGRPPLLASAVLPRSGQTVLLFGSPPATGRGRMTVHSLTVVDGKPVADVVAYFQMPDEAIALPVRDGAGTTLVVLAPQPLRGDSVEVTTSDPADRAAPVPVSASLRERLALVPVPGPDVVTRVRILRDGQPLYDGIPGRYQLDKDVPATLDRIVLSSGLGQSQSVQVRTNGTTACRLTVGGFIATDAFVLEWNPFDDACATVDGSLQLLLAHDRRYSTVAGIAPPGASVRLRWRNGDVTTVEVASGTVNAFLDTSGHRPDRLVLAEALGPDGKVVATARP